MKRFFTLILGTIMLLLLNCGDDDTSPLEDAGAMQADGGSPGEDGGSPGEDGGSPGEDLGGSTNPGGWEYTTEGWQGLPPAPTSRATYRLDDCTGSTIDLEASIEENVTYNGETYLRIALGTPGVTDNAVWTYVDVSEPWVPRAKAVEVYYPGDEAGSPNMAYIFDPPLEIPLIAEEGVPFETSAVGQFMVGDVEMEYDVTLIVTPESYDATVEVPFGTVTGATHVTIAIEEGGFTMTTEAWFHPVHRLVRIGMIPGYCAVELLQTWD